MSCSVSFRFSKLSFACYWPSNIMGPIVNITVKASNATETMRVYLVVPVYSR